MTGAHEQLRRIQHLIVDMDGVLYRGNAPLPGVGPWLDFLRAQGIGFLLATNNSTRTPQQYADKLAAMQVQISPHEVLTSAQATAAYLQTMLPAGAAVYAIGMDGLHAALAEAGFVERDHDVQAVAVGMDADFTMQKASTATLLIRAGAPFIGTNPDRTFPSERGILPGNGALLALIEAATDVRPTIIGKPEPALYQEALRRLGADLASAAVVGDRLETDILGAQHLGLPTLLVLSGVTRRAMLDGSDIQPDLVFDDVAELHRVWQAACSRDQRRTLE
jgi:4-nitrophenyl phosphatase